jgi:hypothetical protein
LVTLAVTGCDLTWSKAFPLLTAIELSPIAAADAVCLRIRLHVKLSVYTSHSLVLCLHSWHSSIDIGFSAVYLKRLSGSWGTS